jgi:hypothetical protein
VVTPLEDEARGKENSNSCSTFAPRKDRKALSLESLWFMSGFVSFKAALSSSMSILNAILSKRKDVLWDGGEGGSMYPEY